MNTHLHLCVHRDVNTYKAWQENRFLKTNSLEVPRTNDECPPSKQPLREALGFQRLIPRNILGFFFFFLS